MRLYEIETNGLAPNGSPSLRSIHKRKRWYQRRQAELDRRQPIISAMYGDRDLQLKDLEVERAQLELAQLRAEIHQTNAETATTMADDQSAKRLSDMALDAIRKRR